jgi:predicted nuclease of predicted toxin-antitoxin system
VRLLIDACVAGSVVRALRESGYETGWVAEWQRDPGDSAILQFAYEAGQVLVTRDKDFGELIFRYRRPHCGIVRLAGAMTYAEQAAHVLSALTKHSAELECFAILTIEHDRIRVSAATPHHDN